MSADTPGLGLDTSSDFDDGAIVPFFAGVSVLSIPFWIGGELAGGELLPGVPPSALIVVAPVGAAAFLSYRERGPAGVSLLLRQALDGRRVPGRWYVLVVVLYPGAMVATYLLMGLLGRPLPDPDLGLTAIPSLFPVFLLGALAEEAGWTGFVLDPMQRRFGWVAASIVLGAAWAAWHWIPLLQVDRSPSWIAWWSLYTISSRVLYTWVYNNGGRSVFAVALLHAMSNLSWQLFPNKGSHFDPRLGGLVTTAMATAAAVGSYLSNRSRGRRSSLARA